MAKLRMKITKRGAVPGTHKVKEYLEGEVYDFEGHELHEVFVSNGWAEEISDEKGKKEQAAPENKALEPVEEDKAEEIENIDDDLFGDVEEVERHEKPIVAEEVEVEEEKFDPEPEAEEVERHVKPKAKAKGKKKSKKKGAK